MSKKRNAQAQRARLRRRERKAKAEALHEAAPEQPSSAPPEASEKAQARGERGQGTSDTQPQPSSTETPPQPFTRSELQDIRSGLKNGASLEAIANCLEFHPALLAAIPNAIGTMAIDPKQGPRDRIAAAKTFAVFVAQRMEQEKRDQKIPERHVHVHEHTGTVTVQERKEFWIHLGQILRDAPEQKERVAALLRQHIEAERDAAASKEAP